MNPSRRPLPRPAPKVGASVPLRRRPSPARASRSGRTLAPPLILLALAILAVSAAWYAAVATRPTAPLASSAPPRPAPVDRPAPLRAQPAAQVPDRTPDPSKAPVAPLAFLAPGLSYPARCAAMEESLQSGIPAPDLDALLDFIRAPGPPEGMAADHWRGIANRAMNAMRTCGTNLSPAAASPIVLLAALSTNAADPTLREYALQHIAAHCAERAPGCDPAAMARATNTLWTAASGRDSAAGTAALGLHRLASHNPDAIPAPAALDARLFALAADPDADPLTRISAMGVCAERRLTNAAPLARQLSASATDTNLRSTAIRALGPLGTPADLPALEQFLTEPDPRIQASARAAIKDLKRNTL